MVEQSIARGARRRQDDGEDCVEGGPNECSGRWEPYFAAVGISIRSALPQRRSSP